MFYHLATKRLCFELLSQAGRPMYWDMLKHYRLAHRATIQYLYRYLSALFNCLLIKPPDKLGIQTRNIT